MYLVFGLLVFIIWWIAVARDGRTFRLSIRGTWLPIIGSAGSIRWWWGCSGRWRDVCKRRSEGFHCGSRGFRWNSRNICCRPIGLGSLSRARWFSCDFKTRSGWNGMRCAAGGFLFRLCHFLAGHGRFRRGRIDRSFWGRGVNFRRWWRFIVRPCQNYWRSDRFRWVGVSWISSWRGTADGFKVIRIRRITRWSCCRILAISFHRWVGVSWICSWRWTADGFKVIRIRRIAQWRCCRAVAISYHRWTICSGYRGIGSFIIRLRSLEIGRLLHRRFLGSRFVRTWAGR